MDNNYIPDTEVEVVEVETPVDDNQPTKARRIAGRAHIIVDSIFMGLATVAFVVYSIMATNFISMVANPPTGSDIGENLGHGIGVAVILIYLIAIGAVSVILSLVSGIISGVGIGVQFGYKRFICIGFTALSALFIIAAVVLFIIGLRVNESVQIGNSAAALVSAYL